MFFKLKMNTLNQIYRPPPPSPLPMSLRNGPDKNDSNNGNEHVGMQKKVLTFLLSVLTSDWLKQENLTKLHKTVHIFILTFQPSSI